MTPAVISVVQTFAVDPVGLNPWVDISNAPTPTPLKDVRRMLLPFDAFTVVGTDSTEGLWYLRVDIKRADTADELTVTVRGEALSDREPHAMYGRLQIREDASAELEAGSTCPSVAAGIHRPGGNQWLADALVAMLQQCEALGAGGGDGARPSFYQSRRPPNSRGKSTGYEWKVIEVQPPQPKGEYRGGTHASPRAHDRRGHWRTYKSGKKVWVRAHRVGDPSQGFIFHTYTSKGGVQHAHT